MSKNIRLALILSSIAGASPVRAEPLSTRLNTHVSIELKEQKAYMRLCELTRVPCFIERTAGDLPVGAAYVDAPLKTVLIESLRGSAYFWEYRGGVLWIKPRIGRETQLDHRGKWPQVREAPNLAIHVICVQGGVNVGWEVAGPIAFPVRPRPDDVEKKETTVRDSLKAVVAEYRQMALMFSEDEGSAAPTHARSIGTQGNPSHEATFEDHRSSTDRELVMVDTLSWEARNTKD